MAVTISGDGTITGSINLPSGTQLNGAALNNGKILQVVNGSHSVSVTSANTTYIDSGLTASITPSSVSNKILVVVFQTGVYKTANNTYGGLRLLRGATSIVQIETEATYNAASTAQNIGSAGTTYLDAPNTTSAVTYKTQFANLGNAGTFYVNHNNSTSTITLIEVAA
jgi:hypothetical protein